MFYSPEQMSPVMWCTHRSSAVSMSSTCFQHPSNFQGSLMSSYSCEPIQPLLHPSRNCAVNSHTLSASLIGKAELGTQAGKSVSQPLYPTLCTFLQNPKAKAHFMVISRSTKITRLQRRNSEFLFSL